VRRLGSMLAMLFLGLCGCATGFTHFSVQEISPDSISLDMPVVLALKTGTMVNGVVLGSSGDSILVRVSRIPPSYVSYQVFDDRLACPDSMMVPREGVAWAGILERYDPAERWGKPRTVLAACAVVGFIVGVGVVSLLWILL